uniref:Membrane transporter protein n=1 Tax=Ditylum brightwellii TaxID=49249 RepID=A0A7S4VM12_9STRA
MTVTSRIITNSSRSIISSGTDLCQRGHHTKNGLVFFCHQRRSAQLVNRQRWRGTSSSSSPPPTPPPPVKGYESPKAFLIGTLAGTLGSLAGMGGGFVMIPLMTSRNMLGLSQHVAHGTSLFAVATTGIAGALGYGITSSQNNATSVGEGKEDSSISPPTSVVELDTAMALALTGMFTARLGASTTTKISASKLKRLLGFFMLGVAPLVPAKAYIMEAKKNDTKNHDTERNRMERLLPASIIGLGSGFLAGLFGVGGGAIVVPALTLSTDMTHHQALGTSLAAMTLPAIVGTVTHYGKGNVSMRVAPMLAMGSFFGAFVGGRFVGLNMDEQSLRYGFSGLMVVLGTKTLLKI